MTQKAISEKMMNLNTEKAVSTVKIIYLDIGVSVEKTIMALVFEINVGSIYTAMTLMNQNIMVLLQIVILESKIWCLGTVIFFLISCLVDVVIENEYPWILYQKFGQLY